MSYFLWFIIENPMSMDENWGYTPIMATRHPVIRKRGLNDWGP